MYAKQILTVLLLSACGLSTPVTRAMEPRSDRAVNNTCVLIDGDDPYILDPFNRPQCACKCIIQACQQSDPAQTELCLRTPWPSPENSELFPDTLVRYAACVGGTHCIGG
ncbi:hypothetical protein GGS26DRAFT_422354 [Hypomontagnella submonticulosa]|nr:hypothetical protein GGS26DRAFT_422354 [Hypomontagnella submonticulosa]